MRDLVVVAPGPIDSRTGGYEYDRRIIAGLRQRGWTVAVRELDASFPHPTPAARDDASRQLASLPDEAAVLIDGLAFGALPKEVEREASRLKMIALVHMPLAAATGSRRTTTAVLRTGQ